MNKLSPFVRVMYWDKELKALWQPRVNRINKAFNIAEHVTVMVGMRDVYVYHIRSTNFEECFAFLRKNDMVFFPIKKTASYSGFSHKHIKPEQL